MPFVAVFLSLLTATCAGLILTRLLQAQRNFRRRLTEHPVPDRLATCLARVLAYAVDTYLLTEHGGRGFGNIEVRFREAQDNVRNLQELVDMLIGNLRATKFADLERLTKCLYQLQYTLNLPMSILDDALRVLHDRMLADSYLGKPIGRLDMITPGMILDGKTMMPLTLGTHVKQPLGFVVFDSSGQVLSKAKVLCS
ncbi:MAG: hypothetical protein RMJ52_17620 [Gemmataceae bacterium]|nr:hypothetical protein [Gemmataceae bacterium]